MYCHARSSQSIQPRTHREGDHFHFSQQIFILSREGARRRARGWTTFCPAKLPMPRNRLVVPRHEFLLHSHSSYRSDQKRMPTHDKGSRRTCVPGFVPRAASCPDDGINLIVRVMSWGREIGPALDGASCRTANSLRATASTDAVELPHWPVVKLVAAPLRNPALDGHTAPLRCLMLPRRASVGSRRFWIKKARPQWCSSF